MRLSALTLALGVSAIASAQNLTLGSGLVLGSGLSITQGPSTPTIHVVLTGTLSSNTNSSQGGAPTRKQLTNCANGWNGTALTPTGVPVGQLYCTTAEQTAAQGAGGPTQGVVASTISGLNIASIDNGFGAGGTDSPTSITSTYGGTSTDSLCSTDPYKNSFSQMIGVPLPGCLTSSSAFFSQTTASGLGNADSLWPTNWVGTNIDLADHAATEGWFRIANLSTIWDLEFDTNQNSSGGNYYGWGMHWGKGANMFQACPQECPGWVTLKGVDPTGVHPNLTTFSPLSGHVIHIGITMSRGSVDSCTPTSGSGCYCYDKMFLEDVTAGAAPVLYDLYIASSGLKMCGIPIDHHTWTENLITLQTQIDSVYGNSTASVDWNSFSTTFYYQQ